MRFTLVIFICLSFFNLMGQEQKMLLSNQKVQLECTEAIDSLYNFRFDVAEKQFLWLKQQYPDHPLSYFLMSLSAWWKIMPYEDETEYDDDFYAYIDTSITLAEEMYDVPENNLEATFFLAASYGFKARLLSDREQYTKAGVAAKRSLNYLEESKKYESDLSPEFLFGIGLYNYFRVWIPENKKFLKPIVMFFSKGDKELGLEQLETVSKNAFYARMEAMSFLMMIYAEFEDDYIKAYPYSKYLAKNYPNNSYFGAYFAKQNYMLGKLTTCEKYSRRIIDNYSKGRFGYTKNHMRKANYYLGVIYKSRGDTAQAVYYLGESVRYAKEIEAQEKGYYWFSLEYLAQFADAKGDVENALVYYDEILEYSSKKDAVYQRAKKYKKAHKEESSWWPF